MYAHNVRLMHASRVNNKFDDYYKWLYGINDFELRTGHKPISRVLPNNEQPTTKKSTGQPTTEKTQSNETTNPKKSKISKKKLATFGLGGLGLIGAGVLGKYIYNKYKNKNRNV